jgi:hypothetical protein
MEQEIKERGLLHGHISLRAIHADGRIETREVDNIITEDGRVQVAELIINATSLPFTALGIGSGSAAAVTSDTCLGTELTANGLARAAATLSGVTTDGSVKDTAQLVVTWTSSSADTVAVTEVGAFTTLTVSGSKMLGRQVFAAVNLVSGDKLEITYKFDVD